MVSIRQVHHFLPDRGQPFGLFLGLHPATQTGLDSLWAIGPTILDSALCIDPTDLLGCHLFRRADPVAQQLYCQIMVLGVLLVHELLGTGLAQDVRGCWFTIRIDVGSPRIGRSLLSATELGHQFLVARVRQRNIHRGIPHTLREFSQPTLVNWSRLCESTFQRAGEPASIFSDCIRNLARTHRHDTNTNT